MKKIVSVCFILIFAANVYAASGGAAFLKKGVGARALGMGGAFTSVAGDANAVYWNPAGLGQIYDNYSVTFMAASGASDEWTGLSDVIPTHNFVALSVPAGKITEALGKSVFAFGYMSSYLDKIIGSSDEGIQTGTLEDTQSAFYLSWGMPVWEEDTNLYVGASLKYLSENLSGTGGDSASGYDIDAGIIYNIFETLNFGLFIGKGASIKWAESESDQSALTSKFGVSNMFNLSEKFKLLGAADLVQVQREPLGANLGLELSYMDIAGSDDGLGLKGLHLRGGVNSLALENRYGVREDINKNIAYSAGFGIDIAILGKFLQLDYAMIMGNILDSQNKISLSFYF
ncbi:MAG: hypothetical protein LBR69_00315 [Endomicrobium sp.]|jgi:hypothetical protein|nr:hypothetical protein [Endomicrobium sp.]